MSKEKIKNLEIKKDKEMRININYINFINIVKREKLEDLKGDKLEDKYKEIVNLRSSNIKRVDFRNKRKELKGVLISLLKERNLSLEDYNKVSEKVINKLSNNKSNYIRVKY